MSEIDRRQLLMLLAAGTCAAAMPTAATGTTAEVIEDAPLFTLITVTHPSFGEPFRFVRGHTAVTLAGTAYQPMPLDVKFDGDRDPYISFSLPTWLWPQRDIISLCLAKISIVRGDKCEEVMSWNAVKLRPTAYDSDRVHGVVDIGERF